MAYDVSDWNPVEKDSTVYVRVAQTSAVEALARPEPMKSDTKSLNRSNGAGTEVVAKGGTYTADSTDHGEVVLTARKFGRLFNIPEEDLADSAADIINAHLEEWGSSVAIQFDNACLGVTAAANGTTVPFTSLYKALATTNAETGYTANDNLTQAGTGGVTYDLLSAAFGDVEDSEFWSDSDVKVIAHPAFRAVLRGIKDDQNNPIFVKGLAGTPDTLFGVEVVWSLGAKTSATASAAPSGNPLLIVGNMRYLVKGLRSGPEVKVAADGSFNTDEAQLKARMRRGFGVINENAFSILEKN